MIVIAPHASVNDVLKMKKPDPSSRRAGLRITWSSISYLVADMTRARHVEVERVVRRGRPRIIKGVHENVVDLGRIRIARNEDLARSRHRVGRAADSRRIGAGADILGERDVVNSRRNE